jgi:hypothetical protein
MVNGEWENLIAFRFAQHGRQFSQSMTLLIRLPFTIHYSLFTDCGGNT